MRTGALAATSCAATLALCTSAAGALTARLGAHFQPERLGARTALSLSFQIDSGQGPPALLRSVDLSFPSDLGFATSGLGLASCAPETIEAWGPEACPPDSIMGSGKAMVEIPIGPELIKEKADIRLAAGPSNDGYLHMLIAVTGVTPVVAREVLSTVLLPGHLHIDIPPIPTLPEAPDVAVVWMNATIGGRLLYSETVRHHMTVYRPPGLGLPSVCPRGGFRFGARFAFIGLGIATGHTAVACPRTRTRSAAES